MASSEYEIRLGIDTRSFTHGMKVLKADLAAASAAYKAIFTGSETDLLKKRVEGLTRIINNQTTQVTLLSSEWEKLKSTKGEFSISALTVERDLHKMEAALESSKIALSSVKMAFSDTSSGMRGFTTETVTVSSAMKELSLQALDFAEQNKSLITGFQSAMYGIFESSTSIAGEFELIMSRVNATLNTTTKSFDDVTDKVKEVAKITPFTAVEIGAGANFMGLAGWSPDQIQASLKPITDFAIVTGQDYARILDLTTDSMNTMGIESQDLTKYLDILSDAQRAGNTTAMQLLQANVRMGSSFTALNIPLEESQAFLIALANTGLKGTRAATAFTAIMSGLTSQTGEAAKMLEKYNIEVFDASGNFRGLTEVLIDLKKAYDAGTDAEKSYIANSLARRSYSNVARNLFEAVESEIPSLQLRLETQSTGATAQQADIISDTTINAFKRFDSAVESFKITIGDLFLPALTSIANIFTGILNNIPSAVTGTVAVGGVGATGVVSGLMGLSFLRNLSEKGAEYTDKYNTLRNQPLIQNAEFSKLMTKFWLTRKGPTGSVPPEGTPAYDDYRILFSKGILQEQAKQSLYDTNRFGKEFDPTLGDKSAFYYKSFNQLSSKQQLAITNMLRNEPLTGDITSNLVRSNFMSTGSIENPSVLKQRSLTDLGVSGSIYYGLGRIIPATLQAMSDTILPGGRTLQDQFQNYKMKRQDIIGDRYDPAGVKIEGSSIKATMMKDKEILSALERDYKNEIARAKMLHADSMKNYNAIIKAKDPGVPRLLDIKTDPIGKKISAIEEAIKKKDLQLQAKYTGPPGTYMPIKTLGTDPLLTKLTKTETAFLDKQLKLTQSFKNYDLKMAGTVTPPTYVPPVPPSKTTELANATKSITAYTAANKALNKALAATTFVAIIKGLGLLTAALVAGAAGATLATTGIKDFWKNLKDMTSAMFNWLTFDGSGQRFQKKLDTEFEENYGPNSEYTKKLADAYLYHNPNTTKIIGMQDDLTLGRNTSKIHLGFEEGVTARKKQTFAEISEVLEMVKNTKIENILMDKENKMEDARYDFKQQNKKDTDLKLRALDKELQAHKEMLNEKMNLEKEAIDKIYQNQINGINNKYDYLKTQNDKIFNDIIMAGINAELQAVEDKKQKKLDLYLDELEEYKVELLKKHNEILDEMERIYDEDVSKIMARPLNEYNKYLDKIRSELGEYPDETISIKSKIDTEGNDAIADLIQQRDTLKNIMRDIISDSDRTSNIAIKQTLSYDLPEESKHLYTQLSQNKVIIDNMNETSNIIRDITSSDVLYREAALQRITDSHIKSQDKMLAKEIENMAYRRDNMNETITIVYRLKNADEDIRTASLDTIYQSEIDANHKLLSVIFKTNYEKLLSWEDYLNSIKELSRANGDDLIELMEKIREFEHDSNNEALLGIIESNKQKLESFRTLTDDIRLLTHKFEDYSIGALKRITDSAISENAKRLADSIFTNNAVINSNNKEIQEILKRRNERNEIDRRAQLELAIKTARTCKQLQDAKKALEEFDLVAAENKVIEALRDHNSELAESIERDTNDINDMIKLEQEDLVKDTDKNFNMLVNNVTGHIGKMKIKLDDDLSAIISGITNSVGKLNYELNFMYKDLQEGISDSIELLSDKQKDIMDDLANVMDSYYADKITLIEENMKKEHELNKEDIEFKTNNNAQILKMDEDNAIMLRDMRTADFDLDMAIEKSRQKFIVEQLDDHHTELINSYIHRLDAEFAEELSAIDRRKRAEEFEHIKRMEDIQGRLDEELELLKKGYDSQIKELNKRYEALLEPFLDAMSDRRDAILRESEKIIQGMEIALSGYFNKLEEDALDSISKINEELLNIGADLRMDYLNEQMELYYNNSKALNALGIPNVSNTGDIDFMNLSDEFIKKVADKVVSFDVMPESSNKSKQHPDVILDEFMKAMTIDTKLKTDKQKSDIVVDDLIKPTTQLFNDNKITPDFNIKTTDIGNIMGRLSSFNSKDINIDSLSSGLRNSLATRSITNNDALVNIFKTLEMEKSSKMMSKGKFDSLYDNSKDKLPIDKDILTSLFKELGIELFAKGGVVNKATLAIIGEGHHSEAVIPLNDKSFGAIASGISSKLGSDKTINTPMLATGGIINSPTLAVIGEGKDSEAVIPLNTKSFSQIAAGIFNQLRSRLDPTTAMLRGLAEIRNSIFTVGIAVVNLLRNGSLVNNNSGQTESIETRMMEHKLPLASLLKINTEALGLIVNVNSSMLTELSTTLIEMTDLIDDTNMLILSNSVEHYDKMVETYGKFNSNLRIMTIKSGLGLRASWEESISGIVSRFESFTSMAYQAGYNFINALYTGMRSQFAQLNNVIEEAEALLKRVRMPEEVTAEINSIIDNVNKDIELQAKLKAPDFNDFKLYADNIGPSSRNNNTEVASNDGITINIDTVNAQNDGDFMAMLNSTIKRAGRG